MNNCCRKKKEIRIHEILSNGQHFNLCFMKFNKYFGEDVRVWNIGLCISKTRREANDWLEGTKSKYNNRQTGTCGLEGLRKALKYILQFVNEMGEDDELQIGWSDEKRKKAYKFLLRYGFTEYDDCYYIRNPKHWEFIKDTK